jgi:hypothetical protein
LVAASCVLAAILLTACQSDAPQSAFGTQTVDGWTVETSGSVSVDAGVAN